MIVIWIAIALFAAGDGAAGLSDPPTAPATAAAPADAHTANAQAAQAPKETAQ